MSNFFFGGDVFLVPISDTPEVETLWHHDTSRVWSAAFSHDGRRAAAAAAAGRGNEDVVVRVWDLQSGEEQVIPLRGPDDSEEGDPFHRGVVSLRFTPAGDLLSAGSGGVRLWDLDTGTSEWLTQVPDPGWVLMDATRDGRYLLTAENTGWGDVDLTNLTLHDRESGSTRAIISHGPIVHGFALDPGGSVIVTFRNSVVRVGPLDGSEPHLLFGHDAAVCDIEVSPDGRWIATGSKDTTIRLWPMPDLSKPPLHTLPREELIAKLKTFTNVRVVRDPESATGWKLTHDPFPGWETVPEW